MAASLNTKDSTVQTRTSTEIWLIGQMSSSLGHRKLPSIREVMALFFHYHREKKETIRKACNSTAEDVSKIWDMARIPLRQKIKIANKIEGVFREWEKLKKNKENKAKRSEALNLKEQEWKGKLDDLFDIAHANALEIIKIQEDKAFLISQRQKGRPGKMGEMDKAMAKKEKKNWEKIKKLETRKEKEVERKMRTDIVTLESSSSDSENDELIEPHSEDQDQTGADYSEKPSTSSAPPPKRGRLSIFNEKLVTSLDVAKLSDRKASQVLTPTIQNLGLDPSKYNVSYSAIRRERIKHRKRIAEGLKESFRPDIPLTIHWDGKLLEDITGHEIVDRLPILVSGEGVDQLLAVPKLHSGTGEATASAIFQQALNWGICDRVKCMGFDTTASNTGPRSGACILLEQKMEKDMLWLACRHHILEIVLQSVVEHALGPSTGPDILLFKRFKRKWPKLDHTLYQQSASDVFFAAAVSGTAEEIIVFARDQLQIFHPRDDYREFLELAVVLLGGNFGPGFSFKSPAGLHRARWMAKAIYSIKIWMFRGQFKLSKQEEDGLRDICIFVVKIYVRFWFTASSAVSAPRNDLQLLKNLADYTKENMTIGQIALKKFMGHLWYLSEELIALAFFDDQVSVDTKRKMIRDLDKEGHEHPLKRVAMDQNSTLIESKHLESFVSRNTRRFFAILEISDDFLRVDPSLWKSDTTFNKTKQIVQNLRVVNDTAERGVALINEYNKLLTNDEEQKQYLLLLVKKYRGEYPNVKKATLMK